jgi:glycosyltransferase involved in cell wall biosynthesis
MESYLSKLVTLGKEWCRGQGRFITVFPQVEVNGTDDDRIVARRLIALLRDAGLPCEIAENLEWNPYWSEIAAQEVFLGCRMHSCIFAMVCGVPTVGLGYQPKFRELFTQLGWPDRSYLIDRFCPHEVATQLQSLSTRCDRQELLKHIDHTGQEILKSLDDAWQQTIENCLPDKSRTGLRKLSISVITPSFKQLNFLKFCAASVRDQTGDFEVEHLIHDGGSGEEFEQWAAAQRGAVCVSETDDGMYDAINRGFRKSSGDIIAWLNCDEQYLPGTLERVARYFEAHPETDILFGDVILVDELMTPLAYRRAVMPSLGHIRHSHLSTFSAATFVRRRVLDEGHYLHTRWKTIADAVWIEELLTAGYQAAALHEPLAIFCMLGSNLGQSPLLFQERREWENELGTTNRWRRQWYIMKYRLARLWVGAYWLRKVAVSAYAPGEQKRLTKTHWVAGQWKVAKNQAENLRSWRDGTMGGGTTRQQRRIWSFLHAVCFLAIAISLDRLAQGDAVKGPFILLLSLLFLSFRARFDDIIKIAFFYFLASWYLLSERPVDVLIVRLGTFSIGAILAIFWSASLRNLQAWISGTVTLIRRIPVPLILTDRQGQIILVNNAACSWFQRTEQSLLNKELHGVPAGSDKQGAMLSAVRDWGERPPLGLLELGLEGDTQEPLGNANVFVVGQGRYRFYAFMLKSADEE